MIRGTGKIRFAEEYVRNGGNATQAYLKVDPTVQYSSAVTLGSKFANDPEIAALIEDAKAKAVESLGLTEERVLQALLNIAEFDLADTVDEHGNVLAIQDIPRNARLALAGFEVEELFEGRGEDREHIGRLKKFKAESRSKALELIGKYLKMFTEKVEVKGEMTLAQLVRDFKQADEQDDMFS